jgi:sn-glycerol 3-phosphate transport system ATP-binding protein
VQGVEYLGADLVLRCGVGTQTLLVRAPGRHVAQAGDAVRLHWHPHDAHGFDASGARVH